MRKAIAQLQDAGVIRSGDGYIEVLDRAGLESRACECYGVVKREFDRLFADSTAVSRMIWLGTQAVTALAAPSHES